MEIKLNEAFMIQKGKRSARWKIIEHPYMSVAYALVGDYCGLYGRMSSKLRMEDNNHIVCGSSSLQQAYKAAYDAT